MGLPPREERRHPGRTVAGFSSPLFLPFFAKSDALMQVKNPTPLNSLYEHETLSRPLCPTLSYRLPISFIHQEHPTTPLECNEI